MNIYKSAANIMQYISEAVVRTFVPNDNLYPVIGVQPFEGEPYKGAKWAD